MSKAECSLRDLHVGDKGRIERVSVSGELGRRIRDLGLIPGTSSRATRLHTSVMVTNTFRAPASFCTAVFSTVSPPLGRVYHGFYRFSTKK